ncbi:MAG: AAA family ATPase [Acidiferrobacteraceae bacterium]
MSARWETHRGDHIPEGQPIDLRAAIENAPPPRDYVLPDILAGTPSVLVAPGGTGKSYLLLALMVLVSVGFDMLRITKEPNTGEGSARSTLPTGPVTYLPAEDPTGEVISRTHAVGTRLSPELRESFYHRARVESQFGLRRSLVGQDGRRGRGYVEWLLRQADGQRLVILDTLRRYHCASEVDDAAMNELLNVLDFVSRETGAAILAAHHVNKVSVLNHAGDSAIAARGSSVITDNARGQWWMQTMTTEQAARLCLPGTRVPISEHRKWYVAVGSAKSNYGPPGQDGDLHRHWLRRAQDGVLMPVVLDAIEPAHGARTRRRGGNDA